MVNNRGLLGDCMLWLLVQELWNGSNKKMNASSSWPYVNSKEKQDQFVYLIRDHSHAQMAIYYVSLHGYMGSG